MRPATLGRAAAPALALVAAALLAAPATLPAQNPPGDRWDRVDPAERSWSAAGLARADSVAGTIGTAAWMLVEGGRVVWQWGDVAAPYRAHSVRKSLLDALYGIHVERGRIDPTVTLGEIGIDEGGSPLGPLERGARLEHLLHSRSGVYRTAAHENEGWDRVRPEPGSHPPGAHFFYSNWDFNVAGVAFGLLTGRNLFEAFDREIAGPIGMQDFRTGHGGWRWDLDRSAHPAFVFRISARDLARFGLLYLDRGRWGSTRVLPAGWVEASVEPRSPVPHPRTGEPIDDLWYGRLWWTHREGRGGPGAGMGRGAFWASGTGEQLLLVSPALDLVLVHRVDTDRGDDPVDGDEMRAFLRTVLEARGGSTPP